MRTEPGGARRVTAHEARAWLVDYVAACRRDAALLDRDGEPDRASVLTCAADDISSLLRRWDVADDGHHEPP